MIIAAIYYWRAGGWKKASSEIRDSRFEIRDSRFEIRDSRFEIMERGTNGIKDFL